MGVQSKHTPQTFQQPNPTHMINIYNFRQCSYTCAVSSGATCIHSTHAPDFSKSHNSSPSQVHARTHQIQQNKFSRLSSRLSKTRVQKSSQKKMHRAPNSKKELQIAVSQPGRCIIKLLSLCNPSKKQQYKYRTIQQK